MADRRTAARTLSLAGLGLCLVWLVLPASPPLYDGLTLPPEPYRYLQPTPKQARDNLPPTSTRSIVPARNPPYLTISTHEQPPQVEIVLAGRAFRAAPAVSRVTLTIRAIPPPPVPPGMALSGNAYAISATAHGRPVMLRHGGAVVVLRAAGTYLRPLMEEYHGGRWERLYASPGYHTASWAARAATLGDFALMIRGKAVPAPMGTPWGPVLIAGMVALGAVAVALFLLRQLRSRAAI
jgi:hypothetical protein